MAFTTQDKCYEVTEAMSTLSYAFFFFSHIMYDKLEVVVDDKTVEVDTLAVDGYKLYVNSGYFRSLNTDQRIAAIAHEIVHAMLMHPDRFWYYQNYGLDGVPANPIALNYAADFIVNDMIKQCKIGELHPSWLWRDDIKYTDSLEDVYRRIIQPSKPPTSSGQVGQQSPGGQGEDEGQGEGSDQQGNSNKPSPVWGQGDTGEGDDGTGYSLDTEYGPKPISRKGQFDKHIAKESDVAESEWKATIESAAMGAKAVGNLSAAMEKFVSKYLEVFVRWDERLADFIKVRSGFDTRNVKRPNRRRLYQDRIYIPTRHSWQIEKVALIFDVSGSVSQKESDLFCGTILQILEQCRPKELRCLCVNSAVMSDDTFTELEEFRDWKPTGSGGTDMEAGIRFFSEEGYDPDVCIILTDGETYTKEENKPSFPVLWVTTHAELFAYGDVLKMDINQATESRG